MLLFAGLWLSRDRLLVNDLVTFSRGRREDAGWGRTMGKKHRVRALPATTIAVAGITLLDIVGAQAAAPIEYVKVYSWSGFYIGGQFGGAWQNYSFGGSFDGFSTHTSSFLAGAYGGYNQRFGNFVFGAEANLDGLTGNNSPVFGTSLTPSIGWEAAIRGRGGYLFTPSTLGYVAVGPAWTNVRASFPSITQSDSSLGWTVGAGLEMTLPFANNLRFRVEYDFSHFSARPFDDLPTSLDVHALKAGIAVPLGKYR